MSHMARHDITTNISLWAYLGLTQWFVASVQQQSIDDSVKCLKCSKMLWF